LTQKAFENRNIANERACYELSGEENQRGGNAPSVLPVELESQLDLPSRSPALALICAKVFGEFTKSRVLKELAKFGWFRKIEELATKLQIGCF